MSDAPRQLNHSPIGDQLQGQWQKMVIMLLWKFCGLEKVSVTQADMQALSTAFAPGFPVLFTQGVVDAIEFQLVDEAAALRIAEHQKTLSGTA